MAWNLLWLRSPYIFLNLVPPSVPVAFTDEVQGRLQPLGPPLRRIQCALLLKQNCNLAYVQKNRYFLVRAGLGIRCTGF